MLVSRSVGTFLDSELLENSEPQAPVLRSAVRPDVVLSVSDSMAVVEADWRKFEAEADCTAFQTFDWQATWLRNIGVLASVTPAIVTGRDSAGNILFILPLAVERRGLMRWLTFLASDLCDYNAPLLSRNLPSRASPGAFQTLWREIRAMLQGDPRFHHNAILLEKMPEAVGAQPNPMMGLPVSLNPSGAYLANLSKDWDSFYAAKRSSSWRKRDRWKRKRLSDSGPVTMVTAEDPAAIEATLRTLFEQKSRAFQRMGVRNIFAPPGHTDFYLDLAANPAMKSVVHVSRLEVAGAPAATNFGLVLGGRYYHVLVSYEDGAVSRFGPGAVHLQEIMKYAIARGCEVFDFTIGDEAYKREWCDTELKLYDFRAAATPRGFLLTLPATALARVKRTIKQTPFLWRMASRARAMVGARKKPVASATSESDEA